MAVWPPGSGKGKWLHERDTRKRGGLHGANRNALFTGLVVVRVRVAVQHAEGRRFSFPLVFSGLGFSPNFLIVFSLYES